MSKALLLIGVALTGFGLLLTFSNVFDTFKSIDETFIVSLIENDISFTAKDNTEVPGYNKFDYIILHNLPYLVYGSAVICIIIALGKMYG